jgi:hypothetical protein
VKHQLVKSQVTVWSPKARLRGGVLLLRLAGAGLCALVLAVVVGLLPGPMAATATAADGDWQICFLDADGTTTCPSVPIDPVGSEPMHPPARLMNPAILEAAGPEAFEPLRDAEEQAIARVLQVHEMPATDHDAVLSWARPEVEAAFVNILLEAAKTDESDRTGNQQALVEWMSSLVRTQTVAAAEKAGEEYARWAGLSVSTYRQKVTGSQEALGAFLSTTPRGTYEEPIDALDPRAGSGYCDYRPPVPYSTEYDDIRRSTSVCFAGCAVASCPLPTPTYEHFVRWGKAGQDLMYLSPEFTLTATEYALAAAGGAALLVATGFGGAAVAAGGMAALGAALYPLMFSTEAVVVGSAFFSAAGTAQAAAALGATVAIAVVAVFTLVMLAVQFATTEKLPLDLAALVKTAQTQAYDPGEMVKTDQGATELTMLLLTRFLPRAYVDPGRKRVSKATGAATPFGVGNCDNSLLDAGAYAHTQTKTIQDPTDPAYHLLIPTSPCLNPTPIPAAKDTDPVWVSTNANGTVVSPFLQVLSEPANTTSRVRVSGHWFIQEITSEAGVTHLQSTSLTYTDWDGATQTAYILGNDVDGYYFAGGKTPTGPEGMDPATCEAAGTCWTSTTLKYKSSHVNGGNFTATLEPSSSTDAGINNPKVVTANPVSEQEVVFAANGFAPTDYRGMIVYEWRFQMDGCGKPCVDSSGAPVWSEPFKVVPTSTGMWTWHTTGDYHVKLTARDADGSIANRTFVVHVGEVPPTVGMVADCAPGQEPTFCYRDDATAGQTTSAMALLHHPGSQDDEAVTIDWGDGTSERLRRGFTANDPNTSTMRIETIDAHTMRVVGNHTYAKPGYYYGSISTRDQANVTASTGFVKVVTGPQVIDFGDLIDRRYGDGQIVHAAGGGSSQPVVFTAGPASVCTSSGHNGEVISAVGLGVCTVTANQAADAPVFLQAGPVSRSFEVGPAPLRITAEDKTRTYGAPDPELTARFNGLRNGDTAADIEGLEIHGPPADSDVGEYDLVPSGVSDPHYTVEYVKGHLKVERAPLTITPDDRTRLYGSDPLPYTADFDGLVNGDTPADINGLIFLGASKSAHVGTYDIRANNAKNANYDYHYVPGTETVTPAPLTITADDVTHKYGSAPAYQATYDGLVLGQTFVPGLTFSGAPQHAGVGEYPIVASGADDSDYDISYVNGTETITPAPLTITAVNKSRVYGSPSPAYTTVFSGLKNLDTRDDISGLTVTGAPEQAGAGSYPIVPSGGSNPNYDISYVEGTETVTRAPLTLTAHDKSKVYGAPDPEFTAAYDGLVNGDTESAISGLEFSAAPTGSDVGTYPIVPKKATSPNYNIAYVDGTETITPAPLTIRAEDRTTKYGTVATYTWKGDGWVNGDSDATIGTAPVCEATIQGAAASVTTAPGAYLGAITCSGATDPNYEIDYANGGLTVNPVIRLDQTGLPSTVPKLATIDGQALTLPTSELEVGYGTAHGYSFPAVVTDDNGVAYMTRTQAFTGPVVGNLVVTASYSTMNAVLAEAVAGGGLDQKTANSLTTTWNDVQAGIKSGNLAKARGSLKQFADAVRSQRGKKIKTATADTLLAYAQLVYTHVGGGTV